MTSYTYDNNGNILTQTDGKGNVTTFQYNPVNKASKRIDGTVSDSSNIESYTYYANGMLKTKKDRNDVTTTYTYDSHRRLIKETAGTESIVYVYDNKGNQISVEDSTGKTIRTFDEINRVKTKTVPYIGTTVFVYDIIEGAEIGCTSEKVKDPKGNITLREYDRARRIKKVTADGKTTSYTYYDNGSKQSTIYPDGSSEEYTYYKDNLLKTLTNRKSDGSVIETYSYSYDSAHNQITKVDKKGTTNYTYDRLNRLETVKEPDGKLTSYKYDKASNRIEESIGLNNNVQSTTYQYDSKNRLTGTITKTGNTDEITKYLYDNNGNLIIKSKETIKPLDHLLYPVINAVKLGKDKDDITKHTAFYEYDSFNRMISTTTGDKTILYKYNSEGYRVEKTLNGNITRYLYEGDKVILEVDGAGNLTAKNVYGANLAARTTEGKTFYYMYNGHGDVTALIDSTGIVATYYYDAFGNILESGGDVNNPYRYAGYEYDDETGCYYLKARYYDPKIARFLSEDTYRGKPDDPLSLNLYTYCHNEPIMYTDPTGHVEVYGNTTDIKNAQEAWGYEGFTYYDTSEKYVDPWDIPADAIIVGGDGADRGVAENPNNALRIWGVDTNATAEAIIRYKPSNDFNSSHSRIDYYMSFGGMSGYQGVSKTEVSNLSNGEKVQYVFNKWIVTAPDRFDDMSAIDWFQLSLGHISLDEDITQLTTEQLDALYYDSLGWRNERGLANAMIFQLWGEGVFQQASNVIGNLWNSITGKRAGEANSGKIFTTGKTQWTATRPKGTQQTYEVYQRNDIDWDMIRTSGDKNFIGKTNAQAAERGLAPQLSDGNFATLHHIGQDSRGVLTEASTRYHGVGKYGQDILHNQYGRNTPNPNFPIDRSKFGVDTREYWQWRAGNK